MIGDVVVVVVGVVAVDVTEVSICPAKQFASYYFPPY